MFNYALFMSIYTKFVYNCKQEIKINFKYKVKLYAVDLKHSLQILI